MDKRKAAKEGGDSDFIVEMRERYRRAVDADSDNREQAISDLKFVTVPGHQWDEEQRKKRKGRPCYEFPILRSHWRQVVNDQKKARPGIKVRPVEDGDAEGAELRQGIIRNIESISNAEAAYDSAFETLVATGFGAFRITTEYSRDDAWDQDIRIRPIADPLTTVWFDPAAERNDMSDAEYAFVEMTMRRQAFRDKYPKAQEVDFDSAKSGGYGDWFRDDEIRIAEYWRKVPVTKTLVLLSDGRTVDAEELTEDVIAQLSAAGVTPVRTRECKGHKVVMSICSGAEELEGPHDSVFDRIPIVPMFANRHLIEGRWHWAGMVRFSRDPQKLVNYNFTAGQEILAKQHKATPLVTPKMLEGAGVKAMWDSSNAIDLPYLPYTPDPSAGPPSFLSPPPVHAAYAQFGQLAIDMLKASDGIYDASVGARSNETSGRAIMARQAEGDTATYDYQDALNFAIKAAGEIIISALPKVYDTERMMRVIGKDGSEKAVVVNQETMSGKLNDLSAGKYDVAVTNGPSYETQRMEFMDALVQLSQGNPLVAQAVPDLIVGSMDFAKADEAAERLKLMLPPPVQQALQAGKDMPPEVVQMQAQMQQMQQMAEQQMAQMQQALQEAEAKAQSKDIDMMRLHLDAQKAAHDQYIKGYEAATRRLAVISKDAQANDQYQLSVANAMQQQTQQIPPQ